MIHGRDDAPPDLRAVFRAPAVPIDLELLAVMELKQLHHQHGHRMQAEVGGTVADADSPVLVGAGASQCGSVLEDLLVDVAPCCRELYGRIIRDGDHRESRGGLFHECNRSIADRQINGPAALLLAQENPMMEHVRLVGIESQTPAQVVRRIPVLFADLQRTAQVVQGENQERLLLRRIGRDVTLDPPPLLDSLLRGSHTFEEKAEVKPGLNESGGQGNRLPVGFFGAGQFAEVGQGGAEVEVGQVGMRRARSPEPGLVEDRSQWGAPTLLQLATVVDELQEFQFPVPCRRQHGSQ